MVEIIIVKGKHYIPKMYAVRPKNGKVFSVYDKHMGFLTIELLNVDGKWYGIVEE